MKIYTKTGDRGTTSLFGGERVDKNSARIKAYGEVDELNSWIGVVISSLRHSRLDRESKLDSRFRGNDKMDKEIADIAKRMFRVQSELFILGSDLATPYDVKVKVPRITKYTIERLEKEIDKWTAILPALRNFILPGGSKTVSKLHMARTIARRAERSITDLARGERINQNAIMYVNRLSDWFFTLARFIAKLNGEKEIIWKGRA